MKRKLFYNQTVFASITFLFLLFNVSLLAQSGILKGKVTDATSGEGLISATIIVGTEGTYTDLEGNYIIELKTGTHTIKFSYVGYEELTKEITIKSGQQTLDVALKGDLSFKEVVLTADIAIDRKTPVAFSNISTRAIVEELASQDLPMILNSTPGVYATQSGGGDGDARINIRGFSQRNIAVMLDGIPVNDMENGRVYWSNWFGLDLVTKTMQVQRGLGASKLAIPSVGGTINILTNGIDSKKGLRVRQEVGTGGYTRTTLGATSGRLDNGWGVSVAGSYKQGNGWVEQTFTQGYFYYLRVDKEIGDHLFSFSGFGAPQEHGQRPFKGAIGVIDTAMASQLINDESLSDTAYMSQLAASNSLIDRGRQFNEHWGMLNGKATSIRKNFYHKPQFSLRHFWDNGRTSVSNVLYTSIGNGGGTQPFSNSAVPRTDDGRLDLDRMYYLNSTPLFGSPDAVSGNFIEANMNNHYWFGGLSTVRTELSDELILSGGIDLRYYEGEHYKQVYDLFGGEYAFVNEIPRVASGEGKLVEGDRFDYDYTSFMRWNGLFGLLEYDSENFSGFLNLSGALIGYSLEDYWKKKVLNLSDTTVFFGADTAPYTASDGTTYDFNSAEVTNQRIDWVYRPSFSIKLGGSYKISDAHRIFGNTGYLSRPSRFTNVIQSSGFSVASPIASIEDPKNEIITALEIGYQYSSTIFSANLNAYYTIWDNKPLDRTPTVLEDPADPQSNRLPVNVNGISARHAGVEFDFVFKPSKQFEIQGLASIGDWIWNSSSVVTLPDGSTYEFDPTGVHVGDAAQLQFGAMIQYRPEQIKGFYLKLRGTYFGKNYSDFTPETLKGATARTESWKMPDYFMMDFHTGYSFKLAGTKMSVRGSILNVLDAVYISDATNNSQYISPAFSDFDAKSASVFFGLGRRWNTSLTININ
ncbi:MAG: TonB-dependent receptor [Saprospiraceae bacterium]